MKREGFTIVELVVAMGIFVVVTAVAVGAFTQALRSERRLTSMMSVDSNASAALEQMAREMRTGYNFSYVPDTTMLALSFRAATGDQVRYALNGNAIQRVAIGASGRTTSNITSSNVNVKTLQFLVSQAVNNCSPWRITIAMVVGNAQSSDVSQDIQIQTTISSRILPKDVPFTYKVSPYASCQ